MREQIDFISVNVIHHDNIQVVVGLHTSVNQTTGEPLRIVLRVAIDRKKAESDILDFTVCLPITNRKNNEYKKILEKFWSGERFVTVKCSNLKVFRKRDSPDKPWAYYGFADGFVVVDYEGDKELC